MVFYWTNTEVQSDCCVLSTEHRAVEELRDYKRNSPASAQLKPLCIIYESCLPTRVCIAVFFHFPPCFFEFPRCLVPLPCKGSLPWMFLSHEMVFSLLFSTLIFLDFTSPIMSYGWTHLARSYLLDTGKNTFLLYSTYYKFNCHLMILVR